MENQLHSALLIGVMSLTTILLRFLPFWIFSGRKQIPGVILYLGDVLPSAVLGMLVIYCLKDVNFLTAPYGCPELMACMAVILVQLWKKNSLWSILTGTVVYMFLV